MQKTLTVFTVEANGVVQTFPSKSASKKALDILKAFEVECELSESKKTFTLTETPDSE